MASGKTRESFRRGRRAQPVVRYGPYSRGQVRHNRRRPAFAPPRRPAFSAFRRAFVTRIGPRWVTTLGTLLSNHSRSTASRGTPFRAPVALVQHTSHVPERVYAVAYHQAAPRCWHRRAHQAARAARGPAPAPGSGRGSTRRPSPPRSWSCSTIVEPMPPLAPVTTYTAFGSALRAVASAVAGRARGRGAGGFQERAEASRTTVQAASLRMLQAGLRLVSSSGLARFASAACRVVPLCRGRRLRQPGRRRIALAARSSLRALRAACQLILQIECS